MLCLVGWRNYSQVFTINMKKEFYIKNMVCDRCKMVVQQIAESFHAKTEEIQLGRVMLNIDQNFDVIQ